MTAAIGSKVFTAKPWRTWLQPSGPNTAMLYAGCYRVTGAPTRPKGDVTLLRCPSPVESAAYTVVGKITGTPGNSGMQLTAPLDVVNWLLNINCDFNLQHRYSECGLPNDPGSWEYMFHFANCRITQDSVTGLDTGGMDAKSEPVVEVVADITFEEMVFVLKPTIVSVTVTVIAGADLVDVSFCDSPSCPGACGSGSAGCQVGFAVSAGAGSVEQIHKTIDGGATWTHQDSPFTGIYDLISAIDCSGDIVIVTSGLTVGTIARSADGGATWTVIDTGLGVVVNDVYMLDAANVWICGNSGHIGYSGNGGLTWVTQDGGVATVQHLNEIVFYNASLGLAVGAAGAIVRSLDGGTTWSAMTSGTANALNTVAPVTEFVWFAAGASATLIYSTDRGETWIAATWPGVATDTVNSLKFCSQFGFAGATTVGNAGVAYVSVDGGYTWTALAVPANTGINAVECCDPNKVFFAADAGLMLMSSS